MNGPIHPVEPEELMAYLDGELPAERGAAVAAHIDRCGECRVAAAESRALSERLAAWQVEPAPSSLSEHVVAAVSAGDSLPRTKSKGVPLKISGLPRLVWVTAGGVCLFLLLVWAATPNLLRSRVAANRAAEIGRMRREGQTAMLYSTLPATPKSPSSGVASEGPGEGGGGVGKEESPIISPPMIVRTASLTLLTRDFDKTRTGLEEAVRRHRGYSSQMTVGSEADSAHRLSATFRVPADQLDGTIAEIKQLAPVVQESQGGEEVTTKYVDLQARLSNARRTEQTLLDLLAKRTGKLTDVLAVEQELSNVREAIERMQAQLKSLQNQVSYSTLQVELREEYRAQLEIAPSIGRRLWNASVEGFRTAADSLVGMALFLLNVGPVLLLWGLILFWPARYVWRRARTSKTQK